MPKNAIILLDEYQAIPPYTTYWLPRWLFFSTVHEADGNGSLDSKFLAGIFRKKVFKWTKVDILA